MTKIEILKEAREFLQRKIRGLAAALWNKCFSDINLVGLHGKIDDAGDALSVVEEKISDEERNTP